MGSVSLTVWLFKTTVSVGTLVSVTVSVSLPETRPEALAVNVAVWVPSTTSLLIVPTGNVTEVAPAGIVTVCGTGDVVGVGIGDRHRQGIGRVGVAGDRGRRRVGAGGIADGVAGEGQRQGCRRCSVGCAATAVLLAVFSSKTSPERVLADHEPVVAGGQTGHRHGRRIGGPIDPRPASR